MIYTLISLVMLLILIVVNYYYFHVRTAYLEELLGQQAKIIVMIMRDLSEDKNVR